MVSNVVLNLLLVFPLAHAGLALATSLSACINAALLFWILRRDKGFDTEPGWSGYLARIILALAAHGAGPGSLFVPDQLSWFQWDMYERAVNVVLCTFAGALAYFAMLWLAGVRLAKSGEALTAPCPQW